MNRQFGALSGLAIILVVLNHTINMTLVYPAGLGIAPAPDGVRFALTALLQLGIFAVPTFLFISGCFATYGLQSGTLRQSYKVMWSRLQHILWPYLIWSVVFYVLLYAQYGRHYTLLEYVKDVLVGYPFNFVPLMVGYYLVSPLLVRLGKRHALPLVAVVAVYQLVLINLIQPASLGFAFPSWMRIVMPPVVSTTMADWAVYFPLGIAYSLHAKAILPWLRRLRWLMVVVAVLGYGLSVLHETGLVYAPFAAHLAPLGLVAVLPLIRRDAIPLVQPLEQVGRVSYGLYLTNLIVADCVLWLAGTVAPAVLGYPLLVAPVLFALTLVLPLGLMQAVSRLPVKRVYRYVFG